MKNRNEKAKYATKRRIVMTSGQKKEENKKITPTTEIK